MPQLSPRALPVLIAIVLSTPHAFAQTEQRGARFERASASAARVSDPSEVEYRIEFDDDPLAALANDGNLPIIKVRPVRTAGYLLRPRTHFVPELLKSVERI